MFEFQPVHTAHLFPGLHILLIDLLSSLSPADWKKNTLAPKWTVKDIAAHLLDTNMRAISTQRDAYLEKPSVEMDSYRDLVSFLNQLNADWVQAFKRVSPLLLIELLQITGKEFNEAMALLPPNEPAVFGVAWAGQEQSPNWFHIAREYSEKWHHQQQIRAAVGLESPLYVKELYQPFLQASMYALPFQYKNVEAEEGQCLKITVEGDGGGDWFLKKENNSWHLAAEANEDISCEIIVEEAWAWRIFMNATSPEEARLHVIIAGKKELALPFFEVRAVMV